MDGQEWRDCQGVADEAGLELRQVEDGVLDLVDSRQGAIARLDLRRSEAHVACCAVPRAGDCESIVLTERTCDQTAWAQVYYLSVLLRVLDTRFEVKADRLRKEAWKLGVQATQLGKTDPAEAQTLLQAARALGRRATALAGLRLARPIGGLDLVRAELLRLLDAATRPQHS